MSCYATVTLKRSVFTVNFVSFLFEVLNCQIQQMGSWLRLFFSNAHNSSLFSTNPYQPVCGKAFLLTFPYSFILTTDIFTTFDCSMLCQEMQRRLDVFVSKSFMKQQNIFCICIFLECLFFKHSLKTSLAS